MSEEKKQLEDNLLEEFIGAKLVRVYKKEKSPLNLRQITLCFDNGRSFHCDVQMAATSKGIWPYLILTKGKWELLGPEDIKEHHDPSLQ